MQPQTDFDAETLGEYYAAVDLGSNSFHMVVVHVANGSVQIIGKVKQKVRLAAGLDKDMVKNYNKNMDEIKSLTKELLQHVEDRD